MAGLGGLRRRIARLEAAGGGWSPVDWDAIAAEVAAELGLPLDTVLAEARRVARGMGPPGGLRPGAAVEEIAAEVAAELGLPYAEVLAVAEELARGKAGG